MIDFLLGLYLAALFLRGWMRGFVKEALDLAGLVIGVAVAFRVSAPLGEFLADRFDVSPEWARVGAGIVLFVIVGLGMALLARWLGTLMRLPGLNLANRVLGAGLAGAWGLTLMLLFVALLRALPMPAAVDETLDESTVVSAVAGPEAVTQRAFQSMMGDSVVDTILALEPLIGERRLVLNDDDVAEIEPATADEIEVQPGDAERVFELLNDSRLAAGRQPLAWSQGLADIALAHARDMYVNGYVSHVSPTTGTVGDRVTAAGIRLSQVGENLALAASPRAVHAGFMDSDGHRENMMRSSFDRVGVAAVRGPLGLMVVEVFGG